MNTGVDQWLFSLIEERGVKYPESEINVDLSRSYLNPYV